MEKFTNPLVRIRIASPCAADWNEMHGDARKRFCGECKLNVYNLSAMTREEAEITLINSEGGLCVRFYRRADGTVLTRNCPIGWAKVKQRVSRTATAAFSLIAGFFGGFAAFAQFINIDQNLSDKISVEDEIYQNGSRITIGVLYETDEAAFSEMPVSMGRPDSTAFTYSEENGGR